MSRPFRSPRGDRVLVTGGAGFIGSSLSLALARDHRVTVVDLLSEERQRQVVPTFAAAGVEVVGGDLHDLDLPALVAAHDRVVHLAGTPGVQTSWADGFRDHLHGNVGLTQRLLEAALDVGGRRVVLASSSSVYGDVADGMVDEATPCRPVSPYGASKAAMELLVGTYVRRGVSAVMLRYFTVVGRRQRPDMAVSRLLDAATGGPAFPMRGDGTQVRDFTHVDDVVRATTVASTADVPSGTVCNIGGGDPVRLRDLVDVVTATVGARPRIRLVPAVPGDPSRTASDCRRAANLLGWRATVDLAAAVADQWAHHPAAEDRRAA